MEATNRTLTHDEARRFYDKFGAKQDTQAFYEDAAVQEMLAHIDWNAVGQLVEFGCGTGRVAVEVLRHRAAERTTYLGVDLSTTMIELARQRLQPYGTRAEVRQISGSPELPLATASVDCVFSCYVLDLLDAADIRAFVDEARRVLRPGGQLGLVSLTHGCSLGSRLLERLWMTVHRLRPALVGGCRPIALRPALDAEQWTVRHNQTVLRFGIASEVLVATRLP